MPDKCLIEAFGFFLGNFECLEVFLGCLAPVCYSAYHGHLTSMIDVSPYKLNLPGGPEKPDWVHVVSSPSTTFAPSPTPSNQNR